MNSLKVSELRELAKSQHIPNYSKLRKEQLISSLDPFLVMQAECQHKRVAVIYGCFCPPHKGHYDQVVKSITDNHIEVMLLQTTNDEKGSRHGVPLEETVRTWMDWGKVIESLYHCKLFIRTHYRMFQFLTDISTLFLITIREGMTPQEFENYVNAQNVKDLTPQIYKHVPRDKIKLVFYLRTSDDLSATNFIKCLKSNTHCEWFVPYDVRDKKGYIDRLRAYNLF